MENTNAGNYKNQDLPDSPADTEKLKSEEVILDLPEVQDIPGQEHIIPPKMSAFSDTTISSDDEEGAGLFEDEEDIPEIRDEN